MSLNKVEIFKGFIKSANDYHDVVNFLKPLFEKKTCILLVGDLAAGKTTFVQKFCATYSLQSVSSPTFSLHQVYSNDQITIDHFDLYRLQTADEIETSGLWDVLSKNNALVFIEWSERISAVDLPRDWKIFEISIERLNDEQRCLSIHSLSY